MRARSGLLAAAIAWLDDPFADGSWTIKYTRAKPDADGNTPPVDIAIPSFGYQNHLGTDRRHRLIRPWCVTHAAAHAGARLADLLDPTNTASGVWADTAYRSQKNEALLQQRMLTSHIHRKKPKGRPSAQPCRLRRHPAGGSGTARWRMPRSRPCAPTSSRLKASLSKAEQKARMGLFVRTIGLARAKTKIGLANLVYNMRRLVWLERPALAG